MAEEQGKRVVKALMILGNIISVRDSANVPCRLLEESTLLFGGEASLRSYCLAIGQRESYIYHYCVTCRCSADAARAGGCA